MVQTYVSWAKGLPDNEEALSILKNSGVVDGIEMGNIDDSFEKIKDAGLKVSSHTPGLGLTLNLANPDYMKAFREDQADRLLYVMRNSDAPFIGLHCGYSAENVYKMKAYPNVPKEGTLFVHGDDLSTRLLKNLKELEDVLNFGTTTLNRKRIVIESLDFSREKPIQWEIQNDEATSRMEYIEKMVKAYGINAGILHVTEPHFIKGIIDKSEFCMPVPVGFCFDIGHNLISADAKIHQGLFAGKVEDYFELMLDSVGKKTHQMHITVPEWKDSQGYIDSHLPFSIEDDGGTTLREKSVTQGATLALSREVFKKCKETLEVITLEMSTGLEPVRHAQEMVRQAEYVHKEILNA